MSNHKQISKFLSYVLRHHPEAIDLEMDAHSWARLSSLIEKTRTDGRDIN